MDIKAILLLIVNTFVHPGVIIKTNNNMEVVSYVVVYLFGLLTGLYAAHKIEEHDNNK